MITKFNQLFENKSSDTLVIPYEYDDEYSYIINERLLHDITVGEGIDEINEDDGDIEIIFIDNSFGYITFDEWKWLDKKYEKLQNDFFTYEIFTHRNSLILNFETNQINEKDFDGEFIFLDERDFNIKYDEYLKSKTINQFKI